MGYIAMERMEPEYVWQAAKTMHQGKRLPDRLYDQPKLFDYYIKNKQWPEAKRCYDAVRDELCSMQADEEVMTEFFGERGERGVILKEGLFREEYVQKAYYEVAVRKEGRCRDRKDERRQKNSA